MMPSLPGRAADRLAGPAFCNVPRRPGHQSEMPKSQITGYRIEDRDGGRTLVVTGAWTSETEQVLAETNADGLDLNYAHGFCEPSLDFLGAWPIRRLDV